MTNLKTATQIKKERPYYYVECYGDYLFESESLAECKCFMIRYIESHKEEVEAEPYEYYIGMYSIGVEDLGE